MAFLPDAPDEAEWRARMADLYASCGPEVIDRIALDCGEWPCVLLIPRDLFSRPCAPLREAAEAAQRPSELTAMYGGDWADWADWAAFSTVNIEDPPSSPMHVAATMREAERFGRLAARLDRGIYELPREQRACTAARQDAADVAALSPCAALRTLWGCSEPEPDAHAELADHEAFVADRLEDMAESCEPLATTFRAVDCSRSPCIAAFVAHHGEPWNETLCEDPDVLGAGVHALQPRPDSPTIVLFPLTDGLDPEAAAEAWNQEWPARGPLLADRVLEAFEATDTVPYDPVWLESSWRVPGAGRGMWQ